MSELLVLEDLTPQQILFTHGGKSYILREPSEAATSEWLASMVGNTQMNPDGKTVNRFSGKITDTKSLLVSRCVYRADQGKIKLAPDGEPDDNTLVPQSTIKKWPARLVDKLFDKVREMGELDKTDDAPTLKRQIETLQKQLDLLEGNGHEGERLAKNELDATTDSSA